MEETNEKSNEENFSGIVDFEHVHEYNQYKGNGGRKGSGYTDGTG